ncbi:Leucine Rich Repeat family protein, partial [Aphelenchoides avenae]
VNLSLPSVYILLSTFHAIALALESASAVIAAAALITSVAAQAGSRRHGQTILAEHDPNSRYVCKGPLSEYAACQCNEEASEVACVNAQFVDAGVFQHVSNYYKSMNRVTFHGNNFQDLPESPLFGDAPYESIHILNISANYIVNLHSKALMGLPNLQELDLSYNEIVLTEANVDFLTHTPRITHLYLRRAFTSVINRTAQFELMLRMFYKAKLDHLRVLASDRYSHHFSLVPAHRPELQLPRHGALQLGVPVPVHHEDRPAAEHVQDVGFEHHLPGEHRHRRFEQ